MNYKPLSSYFKLRMIWNNQKQLELFIIGAIVLIGFCMLGIYILK